VSRCQDGVMASISKFIEQKLKLKINREKSKVGRSEEVKFLGMTIVEGTVVISQKKRRHLYRKLIKRGVSQKQSAQTVYSNNGRWVLSRTWALHKVYPNRWFTDVLGQKLRSNALLKHWFDVREWIVLQEELQTASHNPNYSKQAFRAAKVIISIIGSSEEASKPICS